MKNTGRNLVYQIYFKPDFYSWKELFIKTVSNELDSGDLLSAEKGLALLQRS